jgi:hypothetical protein
MKSILAKRGIPLVTIACLVFIILVMPWADVGSALCDQATDREQEKAQGRAVSGEAPRPCDGRRKLNGALAFFDSHGEATTGLFTAVLAFSTIALWLSTKATVNHARLTSERQLRAYIATFNYVAHNYRLELNNVVETCFDIKNRGQTPATNVRVTISALYAPIQEADTLAIESAPSPGFTLAPGEDSTMTDELPPLDAKTLDGLLKGTKALFLLGEVLYTDAFGKEHRNRLRASSRNVSKVSREGKLKLEWYGADNDST